ncbi:hypothetical protein HMPREF1982_04243 [Clostridiales bacterium oral taxon 876 str. F0540]|nr:hypothetical protein HMPREF1982_04243 [Clostridiales bacterium oral taxon 876 str. F0540]
MYNDQKEEVIKTLNELYPDFETSVAKCIYCCGDCAEKPIARIKGKLFTGSNCEDLIAQILSYANSLENK